MSEQLETRKAHIRDLVPASWLADELHQVLRLRCYEMARVTQEAFAGRSFKIDGERAVLLLFWGSIPYVTPPKFQHRARESLQFQVDGANMKQETPEGPYVLLVVPQLG